MSGEDRIYGEGTSRIENGMLQKFSSWSSRSFKLIVFRHLMGNFPVHIVIIFHLGYLLED